MNTWVFPELKMGMIHTQETKHSHLHMDFDGDDDHGRRKLFSQFITWESNSAIFQYSSSSCCFLCCVVVHPSECP